MYLNESYDVVLADPAKNITAFILSEEVPNSDYTKIANKIMSIDGLNVEQVCFVKKPLFNGISRMEMAGNEFCGNATRSFGLFLAKKMNLIGKHTIKVEVSGHSELIDVIVDTELNQASTSMPLPKKCEYLIVEDNITIPLIIFEGIIHAIAENMSVNYKLYETTKKLVMKKYSPDAFGMMFFDCKNLNMTPIVHVKNINSDVYEQSCGSGSLAASIYMTTHYPDGEYQFEITQPGGKIHTKLVKKNNLVSEAKIGGEVEISNVIKIKI